MNRKDDTLALKRKTLARTTARVAARTYFCGETKCAGSHLAPGERCAPAPLRGTLKSVAGLSDTSRKVGEVVARKLFQARGNHSEIHLNEFELAATVAAGIETALALRDRGQS